MKILALDASTEACSAALLYGEETRERFEIAPREHAQLLLPMARDLLAEAGIALAELDAIAVGQGPGAFTGIRIAMSMAQGLALGADVPVAPVATLAALAFRNFRLHGARQTLVVQDARMREVYSAAYTTQADALPQAQSEPRVSAPDDIGLESFTRDWSAAGNGWAAYPDQLAPLLARLGGKPLETHPHAEDMARLAAIMQRAGQLVPAGQAQPSYVRDDVARKSADQGAK